MMTMRAPKLLTGYAKRFGRNIAELSRELRVFRTQVGNPQRRAERILLASMSAPRKAGA